VSQQRKQNSTAGTMEGSVPSSQQQLLESSENHQYFNQNTQAITLQMSKTAPVLNIGPENQNMPMIQRHQTTRNMSNVRPPNDTQNQAMMVSLNNKEEQELNLLELDDQYYAVELSRGGRGFGFSIRGGREFQSMPLFVLRIAVDGPAAADGRLRVGDQIVEINGVNTKNMTHADAIDLIKSGGASVRLLVRRSNSGGKVPPLIDHLGGMSQLSPTPNPMMSATASVSALTNVVHSGLGHTRPVSAMSQPTTSSMHLQNLSANISASNNINQNVNHQAPLQGSTSVVPTSSGNNYQLPPGAMPLPGMTPANSNGNPQPPNGIPPHVMQQQSSIQNGMIHHHYGGTPQYPNGGPMSHSSPRVNGDQYFWNQY